MSDDTSNVIPFPRKARVELPRVDISDPNLPLGAYDAWLCGCGNPTWVILGDGGCVCTRCHVRSASLAVVELDHDR